MFLLFHSVSYSQLKLLVGPSFGLTSPTMDYSGETSDFFTGQKYGLRSAFNYGALAKLTFGPIKGKLSVSFSSLENSGLADKNTPNSSVEIKNSLFVLAIGTEFGFSVPKSPVTPYIGIDLLFSSISGEFRFQGTPNVNSSANSIQSASRTGLGFSFGADITLSGILHLDLCLKYNLLNLFGKNFKGGNGRIDSYTSLNDAADPEYSAPITVHFVGNDRSLATIQLQTSLLFGF